jgi:hypothetical protein
LVQASGVSVRENCVNVFQDIKLRHAYRYIIYALTPDLREIDVLKTAPPMASYDHLIQDLLEAEQKQECRYAIYDAEYRLQDGQQRSKLVFFLWSPETARIKQKMVYTSSKDALKRKLIGIAKEIQACDHLELSWTNVMEHLLRTEVAQ